MPRGKRAWGIQQAFSQVRLPKSVDSDDPDTLPIDLTRLTLGEQYAQLTNIVFSTGVFLLGDHAWPDAGHRWGRHHGMRFSANNDQADCDNIRRGSRDQVTGLARISDGH